MFVPPMLHLSTCRSRLRMGNEGVEKSNACVPPPHPHPPSTQHQKDVCASTAYPEYGLSRPSCEGKLPPRSLLERYLREERRSGIMGETATNAEGDKCDARALPLCATTLRALPPPTLPRLGGGGAEVRWLTVSPAQ